MPSVFFHCAHLSCSHSSFFSLPHLISSSFLLFKLFSLSSACLSSYPSFSFLLLSSLTSFYLLLLFLLPLLCHVVSILILCYVSFLSFWNSASSFFPLCSLSSSILFFNTGIFHSSLMFYPSPLYCSLLFSSSLFYFYFLKFPITNILYLYSSAWILCLQAFFFLFLSPLLHFPSPLILITCFLSSCRSHSE